MGNQQVILDKDSLIKIPIYDHYYTDGMGGIYSDARGGRIKRLKCFVHYGRGRKPFFRVRLKDRLWLSHRIIATVHLGRDFKEGEFVNHIDGNSLNNRLSNLEVVSHSENVAHAVANNLYQQGDEWYISRGMQPSVK